MVDINWDVSTITIDNYEEELKRLPIGLKVIVLQKLMLERLLTLERDKLENKKEVIECLLIAHGKG